MCLRNQSLCPRAALSCGFPQPGGEEERAAFVLPPAPRSHAAGTRGGTRGQRCWEGWEGKGPRARGCPVGAFPRGQPPRPCRCSSRAPREGLPAPSPIPVIPIARLGGARAASSPQPHPASYLSPPYPALAAGPFPYRACCCASARIWAGNSLSPLSLSLPPQPGSPDFGAPTPRAPLRSDQLHATEGGEQRGESPGRPLLAGFFFFSPPPRTQPSPRGSVGQGGSVRRPGRWLTRLL